jgi:hypothetical protein
MRIMKLIAGLLPVLSVVVLAQDARAEAAPYCAELKRIAALASSKDRFASIAGAAREGGFSATVLPLPGWKDCALYGAATYTCDSQGLASAEAAEEAQVAVADQILSCFAGTWLEIKDRSSPRYVVLNPARGPASITLSVDEDGGGHAVVRLTLFIRRN